MKTIVLFAPQGPNSGAEGMVTKKFVDMLRNRDWRVIWLYQADISDYPNSSEGHLDDIEVQLKHSVRALVLSSFARFINLPILKSLAWCFAAKKLAASIIKRERVDLVSSRIMPKYGHLPALLLSRNTRLSWHVNWSDPMPESKAPHPYGQGTLGKISFIMSWFLHAICKRASCHTFPTKRLQNLYLSYMSVDESKCEIIPHLSSKIENLGEMDKEDFILSYIGGGLHTRNPRNFFHALSRVRGDLEAISSFKIQFVGPREQLVEQIAQECGVSDLVHFLPPVTYEESIELMKKSSVNLVLEADMVEGVFLPSKVADIVSCDTPMLAVSPRNGVMHDLLERFGGGLWADCTCVESIEKSLRKMIDDWKNNKMTSSEYSSLKLAEEFSEEKVYENFINLINRTTK